MYRAVSQGTIRFNPFEEVKYEAVERKPRFLSKGDVSKLLAFPFQDKGAELSRRMFYYLLSVHLFYALCDLHDERKRVQLLSLAFQQDASLLHKHYTLAYASQGL